MRSILADQRVIGGSPENWQVARLSGGHSHVTWLVSESERPRLVVKVAQADGPLAPYDVAHEAEQTRIAGSGGVPAPAVLAVVEDNALGSPLFVMEHVAGEAPGPEEVEDWLARGAPGADRTLTENLVAVLARAAQIGTTQRPALDVPAHYRAHVASMVQAVTHAAGGTTPPALALVGDALAAHADVLEGQAALVHGDFRPGNMILGPDGAVRAVLDWERSMWGHPLHDLGFLRLPSMYRGRRVAGLVDDETLRGAWRTVHGDDVDERALGFTTILGALTEFCACLRALLNMGPRLDLLRVMPLIARHEHDMITMTRRWLDGRTV